MMSMHHYIRDPDVDYPEPTPDELLRTEGKRSLLGLMLVELLTMIGIACVLMGSAHSATESEDSVTVQLRRGSSTVTLMPAPLTLAECEQRKVGLIAIDADTRFSGTATYSCIETRRSVVTFSANAPPPPPVDCAVSAWTDWVLGTPTVCANDQQTRQDSRTRTIVTQPANGGTVCPELTETRTETLACTVTPPPPPALTAPTLATPTHEAGTNVGRYNVILSWSAVPGATSYRVNRCVGSPCSTMSVLAANVTGTTYKNTGIPLQTYKYQVYARRGTSEIGPASNLQVYTVTAIVPPPPPPGAGTAKLDWTAPTTNIDKSPLTNLVGFRIVYGRDEAALTNEIRVANPSATTHVVPDLTPGTWYFGLIVHAGDPRCFLPGADCVTLASNRSNLVSRVVQ